MTVSSSRVDEDSWRPAAAGASFFVLLSACLVVWIDGLLPNAISALRAVQLQPDYWVVDYIAIGPVAYGSGFVDATPDSRFRASRVECRVLADASQLSATKLSERARGRGVRCKFFRLPFLRLVTEAGSVERARPEVLEFIRLAPYPFSIDASHPTASVISYFSTADANQQSSDDFLNTFLSHIGYLGSSLLIALLLFRSIALRSEVTVSCGLQSLRACSVLLTFFITALSLPLIAAIQLALQSRPDVFPTVNWLALQFVDSCVLGPIAEEIVFRAWLIPFLSRAMDVRVAATISSLLFLAAHWPAASVGGLIGDLVATALFTGLWLRSKSLWICVLAHAAWNLAIVIRSGGVTGTVLPL